MQITPNIDPLTSPEIERTAEEARQGMITGQMRYVLSISLTVVVLEKSLILAV